MSKTSHAKSILAQALIQVGMIAILALGAFALNSCARKNTNPPAAQGSLATGSNKILNKAGNEDTSDAGVTPADTAAIAKGEKLLALILKDKALSAYLVAYQKKNNVVCTRPSGGQIHWNCKTATECTFSLESTCVSNIDEKHSNDEFRRLSILGEGNSAKMTYKISDPTQTAAESKIQKLKFEF